MLSLGLPFIMLGFLLFSCDSDKGDSNDDRSEMITPTMVVKGFFGTDPLQMYAGIYPFSGDLDLRLQLFQFYISDIGLIKTKNGTTDTLFVSDIDLISFADIINADDAKEGVSLSLDEVPADTYDGIVFGVGVAPAYNATQPGDYTPPHPLDDHYWSWARGYVFAKIEGNADLDRDGNFEQKLTFHMGGNDAYRQWYIQEPIVIGPSNETLRFHVDLEKVLKNENGEFLDFRQVTQDHSNDADIVSFVMDNLRAAIRMEQN